MMSRVVFFLMLLLVGMGFLFSESINTHLALAASDKQIAALSQQNAQLHQQVLVLERKLEEAQAKNMALENEKAELQSRCPSTLLLPSQKSDEINIVGLAAGH